MRKCPVDLSAINVSGSSDDDVSTSGGSSSNEFGCHAYDRGLGRLSTLKTRFLVQNFSNTKTAKLFRYNDADFDLASLNRPLLPQNERELQPIDFVCTVHSSVTHFPPRDSEYLRGKPVMYLQRDMSSAVHNDFVQYVTTKIRELYAHMRPRLRFNAQIDPSPEKIMTYFGSLRREVQNGRVMFHYIGFGFPIISQEHFHVFDPQSGLSVPCSISDLVDSIGTPSWFIFDCSNAAAVIETLQARAMAKTDTGMPPKGVEQLYARPIDWCDWFCMCATDVGERLPNDPHLPRDFLTSCLFSPVRTAIVCHAVQYYRTTLVSNKFPVDEMGLILTEGCTEIHTKLERELMAITDAIAADTLPSELYRLLFRRDRVIMSMFQRFLLAQYLLHPFQVHPRSVPELPDLSSHRLWSHWRLALDTAIASLLPPHPQHSCCIFTRVRDSVYEFLERGEEACVLPGHLVFLFHVPDKSPIRESAYILLARYAATSQDARKALARVALFGSVFSALASGNFQGEGFRALCYLTISLLQNEPRFVNDVGRDVNVADFPLRLFEEKLSMPTRTLVASIIATVLPHFEGIRSRAVDSPFMKHMRTLLETSDATLSLWALMIQRRMFDSFGSELRTFFSVGMHIQVASFALHRAPEVRAAALATIPCFLQQKSHFSNSQLFGLTMTCAFDASYLVRFNFILFLSRFLTVYPDRLKTTRPAMARPHESLSSLMNTWIGEVRPLDALMANFDALSSAVDHMCGLSDSVDKFIGIALYLVLHLTDDPHPSVRQSAADLQSFVRHYSNVTHRVPRLVNFSVPPNSDRRSGATSGRAMPRERPSAFYGEYERPAMGESGGDAMYKVCVRQIVTTGWTEPPTDDDDGMHMVGLPQPALVTLPSTRLKKGQTWKSEQGKPTMIAFHRGSISMAVATTTGNVIWACESSRERIVSAFKDPITALSVTDWDEPLVIVGTERGGAYVWSPTQSTPRMCFRPELSGRGGRQVLTVLKRHRLMSSRGGCGTMRLWDLEGQRVINEWDTGVGNEITALTFDPANESVCMAGFANGSLVSLDIRCPQMTSENAVDSAGIRRGSFTHKAHDPILKICANVGSTTSFFCGTASGSFMQWETLDNIRVQKEGVVMADFAVHPTDPISVLSPASGYPTICDLNMKVIHTVKGSAGCVCALHPALPIVAFASPSTGEIVQYEMMPSRQ